MDPIDKYILSHSSSLHEGLEWIRRQTYLRTNHFRMLSGPVEGSFLSMLVSFAGVRKALEIGTFTGYSSACIALGLPQDGHLDTLEIDDEMVAVIKEGWRRCEVEHKITLHIGDALKTLADIAGSQVCAEFPYDMAFIDANKREYRAYFEAVLPLVRKDGLILADNTLWDGKILESPLPVDAQTQEIAAFNDAIAADPRVEAVILPLRDGLTLIRKK